MELHVKDGPTRLSTVACSRALKVQFTSGREFVRDSAGHLGCHSATDSLGTNGFIVAGVAVACAVCIHNPVHNTRRALTCNPDGSGVFGVVTRAK